MTTETEAPNILPSVYKAAGVEVGEELPAYAWPGGYPISYLDAENNELCADCANRNNYPAAIAALCVLLDTSEPTFCDQCSTDIAAN